MTASVLTERRGAQRPTKLWVPPGRVTSAGPEYIDAGREAGIFLDDWQEWHLDEALAERSDGNPVADEVCLLVPRQNGKDEELLVLEIGDLFVAELPIVVHSAHQYKTVLEHFRRLRDVIRRTPELYAEVGGERGFRSGGGSVSIELLSGSRLLFVARSKASTVGFAGVPRIIYNEAFILGYDTMGASGPTTLTRHDSQTWYVSSQPHVDSEVLHDVRKRGIDGGEAAGRLFFCSWENEPDTDPHDLDAIALVNPALNAPRDNAPTEQSFVDMLRKIETVEFVRECLGVPSMPDGGAALFGAGKWLACEDVRSKIITPPTLALDVGPEMAWASFGVAGFRKDGLPHIELIERDEGTSWIVGVAKQLKHLGPVWVLPSPHPVSGVSDELHNAGIDIREVPAGAFPKACATLQNLVMNRGLRHVGQKPLDNAVSGAAVRTAGEGWTFARGSSTVDITPLVVCTVALSVAMQVTPPPQTASNPDVDPAESIFTRGARLDL